MILMEVTSAKIAKILKLPMIHTWETSNHMIYLESATSGQPRLVLNSLMESRLKLLMMPNLLRKRKSISELLIMQTSNTDTDQIINNLRMPHHVELMTVLFLITSTKTK